MMITPCRSRSENTYCAELRMRGLTKNLVYRATLTTLNEATLEPGTEPTSMVYLALFRSYVGSRQSPLPENIARAG